MMSKALDSILLCALGAFAGVVTLTGCSPSVPAGGSNTNGIDNLGNAPPVITFAAPTDDLSVDAGDAFDIQWDDADPDSNANISIFLVPQTGGATPMLLSTVKEDDSGDDSDADDFTVDTSGLLPGTYRLLLVIDDGANPSTNVTALNQAGEVLTVTLAEPP